MAAPLQHQFWLFQYTEGVRVQREFELAAPGEVTRWKLTQHRARVREGDVVFFWRAGPRAGLQGWGRIAGGEEPSQGEEFGRVPVRVEAAFGEPIPRDEVRAVPEISDLPVVVQGRPGTNFPVSSVQAFGLARLIERRGFTPPPVDTGDVRRTLARRLERDLARMREAAEKLPEESGGGMRERIDAIQRQLAGDDGAWDPGELIAAVEALKSDEARPRDDGLAGGAGTRGGMATSEAVELKKAASRVQANFSELKRLDLAERGVVGDAEGMPAPEAPPADLEEIPAAAEPPRGTAPDDHWNWLLHDRVGIGPAVDNLARYIANEELAPPQAIGIFGEWGSGKTFFMSALKSQIALLAHQSRKAVAEGRTSMFCSRIVQIDFNAWHYVESNLWASLAGHVFEKLHQALKKEAGESPAAGDPDALFRSLATYHEAMRERDRREAVVKELKTERDARARALQEERDKLRGTAKAIRDHAVGQARAALEGSRRAANARLAELLGKENVAALAESADELEEVVRETRTFGGQVSVELRTWGPASYLIAIGAVLAAVLALPPLAEWLSEVARSPAIASAATLLGGYLATAAGAVSIVAARGKKLLDAARAAHGHVVTARENAERAKATELAREEDAVAAAEEELARAERDLQAQREQLAAVEAALHEANPGVQLRSFLEERVRDRTYEQHLGLVSLVRKDFERLSDLMVEHWARRDSANPVVEVAVIDEEGKEVQKQVPFLERIVLYVDDLDRCPPEKVVDVLQAVHLMLGFKLFVVVVGVDVRWVGRSLFKQYEDLLSGGQFDESPASEWRRASSDDYLEKIFQIPFRLVPLHSTARQQFVMSLVNERFPTGWRREGREDGEVPVLELNPRELSLYPQETACIDELHGCLGRSPRRVKRFVDVYRLMRAGMESGDVEAIMTRERYRQILALFALLTGSARLGPRLIEELDRALRDPSAPPLRSLSRWLDTVPDLARYDQDEVASARAVFAYLDGLGELEDTVEGLTEWIPAVAQYSFREVRLRWG